MRKLNGLLKMQKLTESSEMSKIEITVDIYHTITLLMVILYL